MSKLTLFPCLICLIALSSFLCLGKASLTLPEKTLASVLSDAVQLEDWIVGLRRTFHSIPELGFEEHLTAAKLSEVLTELGIPHEKGVAGTGLIAHIGSGPGPVVLLRTDIDALPVEEPEGLEFRSTHAGRMHACGHDSHMAMLLGAAKILKSRESSIRGRVKLVFQPFEEGGAGADIMLKTGALDDVHAAFGMHVMPHMPVGVLGTRGGTIMAGALSFVVTVTGRGGHAAMPHQNVDPVVAAAAVITGLQTLVSRETSPLGSAVLSVTLMRAGEAYNVIPETAQFGGTIRALDHSVMERLQQRLEALSSSVAQGFGCTASVDWRLEEQPYYPPTVNDPDTALFTQEVASRLFGKSNVVTVEPIMAGEDFAFYCQKVPCTFAFMGIRNETLGSVHALHSPWFKLDESVLYKGAAMHAAWAMEYMAAQSGTADAKEEL